MANPIIPQQTLTQSITPGGDFVVTKGKRQQLRELLIEPEPVNLHEDAVRSSDHTLSDPERKVYRAEVDKAVRWDTFRIGQALKEHVVFISDKHNVNEEEYQSAWAQAIESHNLYKTNACGKLVEFTTSLTKDPGLRYLDDAAFREIIDASFTTQKFFDAFSYLQDYLNLPGSTARGKWYATEMWTSMVLKAKHYVCNRGELDRWTQLSRAFAIFALSERYDEIKTMDFSKLTHVYRSRKEKLRREVAAAQSSLACAGPMPAEEPPAAPSDFKVIDNSADFTERPSGGLGRVVSELGINASRPGTHSNIQNTPIPASRGAIPRPQSQPTESESDFGSKHGGEAEEDPSAKVSACGDGGSSHGAMADVHDKGAEDTRHKVKAAKHKVKKSKKPVDDGGFGFDLRAAMAALQDSTDVEEAATDVKKKVKKEESAAVASEEVAEEVAEEALEDGWEVVVAEAMELKN